MSMLDTFNSDNFNVISLTTALNLLPYQPGWLGRLGIFQKKSITTKTAVVESREGLLSLVQTSARGTVTQTENRANRIVRSFLVPHLAQEAGILAEDVQSVRAFGAEDITETFVSKVLEVAEQLRADIDTTKEYQRTKALEGIVLDADGSVIFNYFTEFGQTETTIDFILGTQTTDVKAKCAEVVRDTHTALGATPITGIIGYAGNDWWDAFVDHDKVKAGYERWNSGQFLRTSQMGPEFFTGPDGQDGFSFAGINFFNSRAGLAGTNWIADGECRFFPLGVPDLFQEVMAPADYIETVNTLGKEFYVKQERQHMDKGIDVEVQANPLIMPTRPAALIKGTTSGP